MSRSYVCLFTILLSIAGATGCGEDEPAATEPGTTASTETNAEEATLEEPAAPEGMMWLDVEVAETSYRTLAPTGSTIEAEGPGARVMLGDAPLVGLSEPSNSDRAHHEGRIEEAAPTLAVERAEDTDNGWLIVATRQGGKFDIKQFREDLGVFCSQRMLADQAAVAQALAVCDALAAGE